MMKTNYNCHICHEYYRKGKTTIIKATMPEYLEEERDYLNFMIKAALRHDKRMAVYYENMISEVESHPDKVCFSKFPEE